MRKSVPVLFVVGMLALQGCQSTAPPATAGAQSQEPVIRSEGQTLWHLVTADGKESTQLQDDDPDVQAVRKEVVLHSGIVDNRDPGSIGDSITRELGFYSQGFARKLADGGYRKAVETHFSNNNIHSQQSRVAWYASTISDDRAKATANFETTFAYTEAAPQYLAANGLKLNLPYTQRRQITLEKTDGTWRIADIQKTGLTEAKAPPTGK